MEHNVDKASRSYYSILGVSSDSSSEEIKRAYRKLALQWHPDRRARAPSSSGEAKVKFQQIQEAYSVLSDRRKRTMYDSGLYDPEDEEDEGFSEFVEEMVSLMVEVRKRDKDYSMEELQAMLTEMAQGFDSPTWFCSGPAIFYDSYCSKKTRLETNTTNNGDGLFLQMLGTSRYGASGLCN